MKAISYLPSEHELLLKLGPLKGTPKKEVGRFKLWWDDEGNICAIDIKPITEELEDFKRNLNTIQLSGIWKGVKITDEDINETRRDLLRKIEEKW